jgi:hypothetical protein
MDKWDWLIIIVIVVLMALAVLHIITPDPPTGRPPWEQPAFKHPGIGG